MSQKLRKKMTHANGDISEVLARGLRSSSVPSQVRRPPVLNTGMTTLLDAWPERHRQRLLGFDSLTNSAAVM